MDDNEILKQIQKSTKADFLYFSNKNKEERERWVVSEFLSIINIKHRPNELQSLEQANKIDVSFRDACFQIKELPNPNLKRGKMYKDIYYSAKVATSIQEVVFTGSGFDIPDVTKVHSLVLDKAVELSMSESYKAIKHELDLLIYVTRSNASLIQSHEIQHEVFSNLG